MLILSGSKFLHNRYWGWSDYLFDRPDSQAGTFRLRQRCKLNHFKEFAA
jgi:hypothetical protein